MSLRTRALIFATFLLNCLSIGLLLMSLTTNYWIVAYLKRDNVTNSRGTLNYGLFYGTKDLNTGFGERNRQIDVYTLAQNEPDIMNFWLWLLTTLGTGIGLLSSLVSAIIALWKTAASTHGSFSIFWLIFTSTVALLSQMTAFISWLMHFIQYLRRNVLSLEDRRLKWRSQGSVFLGYSFYLVVLSTIVVLCNIAILLRVRLEKHRRRDRVDPNFYEQKNNGAIMLY